MTCLAAQDRSDAATVAAEAVPEVEQEHPGHRPVGTAALREYLRTDAAFPQLVRFMLVGGTSTALYALLFLALRGLGTLPAHVIATAASSVLANELHRRLTFRAEERVHFLSAQVEAGTVSVIGLLATSAALVWLQAAASGAPPWVQISLVATVTAVIGGLRFVALRWIFRPTAARS